jgi:O-antigen ligase
MGISMVESPDKIRAIKEWGRIGSLVFIYVLAGLSFKGEKDVRQFVKVLLLSLIIPLGLAGYQLITNTGYVSQLEGVHRIMGTFGNPVVFALYLTFPLLLCITMFMDRKMRYEGRFFFGFGVLLFACSLFLTYTRSSWFGLMAGIMVIGLKRSKGLLVGAALLALLVLLVVPLESIRLGEFTTGRLSFSGRIAGWKMMLPLVKDYPIFGHGLTSFGDVTTQSDHVRLLLETGFLGWIVFLCLILVLLKALLKTYRSLQPGIEKNFVLAYLAFFVCTIVISFSETNALLQYYVWIPAGIVLAKSIRGSVKIVDAAGAPQGSKGSSSLGAPGLYPRYSYKAGR